MSDGAVFVLDTVILYATAQPWELEELTERPAEFVVPATVLFELDHLVQRRETRPAARAALNVLEQHVKRGAARQPVSCGEGRTIRLAAAAEESEHRELNLSLADDRIIATALHIRDRDARPVHLVTAEFAMHAKAVALGLESRYLPKYQESRTDVSRKDAARFKFNWEQIIRSRTPWEICRRSVAFIQHPLVRQILEATESEDKAGPAVRVYNQFLALHEVWTGTVNLDSLLKDKLGYNPAIRPNRNVVQVQEPGEPWKLDGKQTYQDRMPSLRNETPEERALRIAAEQQDYEQSESYVVDQIRTSLEILWEYMVDQVGEELL